MRIVRSGNVALPRAARAGDFPRPQADMGGARAASAPARTRNARLNAQGRRTPGASRQIGHAQRGSAWMSTLHVTSPRNWKRTSRGGSSFRRAKMPNAYIKPMPAVSSSRPSPDTRWMDNSSSIVTPSVMKTR